MSEIINTDLISSQQKQAGFKKGHGHGRGRPVGSRNKVKLAIETIREERAEQVLDKITEQALEGDRPSQKIITELVWVHRKGSRPAKDLPPLTSMADIKEFMFEMINDFRSGTATPAELQAATQAVEAFSKTILNYELQPRIDTLEGVIKKGTSLT